jgi:hypothetical protein
MDTMERPTSGRMRLATLAEWLEGWDYDVSGPIGDDREVIVTIDEMGGVHLSAPPEIEPD